MKKQTTARIGRWFAILSIYDIEIKYLPGNENIMADYLSREYLMTVRNDTKIKNMQEFEDKLKTISLKLKDPLQNKVNLNCVKSLFRDSKNRIFIPDGLDLEFIEFIHEETLHGGIEKIYYTVKNYYYIPNIKEKIKEVCDNCISCGACKHFNRHYGKVEGHLHSCEPFKKISSDIFGPVVLKEGEKIYFVTFIDLCTRWVVVQELKCINSENITKAFDEKWIRNLGKPDSILTDQGRQYLGSVFKSYCKNNGIRHKTTLAFNPTGNSISERINQSLGLICRIHHNWSGHKIARHVSYGINNSYHSTLGYSPYELKGQTSNFDIDKRKLDINLVNVNERVKNKSTSNEQKTNLKRDESYSFKI